MSRARGAAARPLVDRNAKPAIKPWHEEYTLSDTSASGLRYLVNGVPSVPAGSPNEPTWPYNKSMAHHCIWPRNYRVYVQVDWEGEDIGGGMKWDMVMQHIPAWTLREILQEHAEEVRLIALLERHLGIHPESEVA